VLFPVTDIPDAVATTLSASGALAAQAPAALAD